MKTDGIGSAHLVGHSMGGELAMQMAIDHPEKVKTLTLICAAGLGPEISSYVRDFNAAQGRKDLKPVLETLFADKSLVSRQLVDDVLKFKRLDGVGLALTALGEGLFGGQVQKDQPGAKLGAKAASALVIWGKEDQVIPASHAERLPGAKVHVIEGAGHMVFMEKAGEVNALIKAHIA
jgi:pyruvate dehydrogenase E2 component (dihydrolipoamide acetyltransferase)